MKTADKQKQRQVGRAVPTEQRRRELNKAVCRWLCTVALCVVMCAVLFPLAYEGIFMSARRGFDLWGWWPVFALLLILLFIVALSTGRMAQKTLEYRAPAVAAENLPAEEVLVRGAEEPSSPSETLLRAAQADNATAKEELLRSHQGKGE